jgi:hypothetical protein
VRLSGSALEDHVADVVELLERYGALVDEDPQPFINASQGGARWFEVRAGLPDGRAPSRSVIGVREVWQPVAADACERREYEYELLDRDRDSRRAFHLHDRDVFARVFDVVVHEHCEQPIGTSSCDHYAGQPVRDAFAGVELLVGTWVDPDTPDCGALLCLEAG